MGMYNYPQWLKTVLKRLDSSALSERNKELVKEFYEDCAACGLSKPRLVKLVGNMVTLGELMPDIDFDKATKKDIKSLVHKVEMGDWKQWTKSSFKVVIKKFYKWLKGDGEKYPEEVRWIKATIKSKDLPMLSSEELLTESEIKSLIDASSHPRNKAFIALLSESGCRIGEIGSLQIRHVSFDKYGTVLTVTGKTGSRRIRVVKATQFLSQWVQCHPQRDDPKAPLWINIGAVNHGKPMMYPAMRNLLKRLFRRAGIDKKCNPHLFRHSRASVMANHMTEFQMNQYFGWVQGSGMPSTYVHLSGKDLDDTILKMNGMVAVEEEEKESPPVTCPRCQTMNVSENKYCSRCALVLDEATALEMQKRMLEKERSDSTVNQLMDALMADEEIKQLIMQKAFSSGLAKNLLD